MIYTAIAIFFFFVGACVAYDRNTPRILKPHDDSPFTSTELRKLGIMPPEKYDEWLDPPKAGGR